MKITIRKSITEKLPNFNIIALSFDCECFEGSEDIDSLIKTTEEKIRGEYSLEDVLNIPLIKEARDGYKILKKDPSRYRLAVESLYRRIVKGNSLYRINSLVDLGNVLSIETKRSVAALDLDKINGDIYIRLGKDTDVYEGIGRGLINVENIPLYEDEIGPFGSTTSDTPRTSITLNTKHLLVFIVCFSKTNINSDKEKAIMLFTKYGKCKNVIEINVENELD